MLMIFSFFFIAPGLLFKLRCLMVVVAVLTGSASSAAGKASVRELRLAMSFFAGRLCRFVWGFDFSIREM